MDPEAEIIENQSLPLKESSTIEERKVKLNREWSFWENYEPKDKDKKNYDYSLLLKNIYTFTDLISFWQFWNARDAILVIVAGSSTRCKVVHSEKSSAGTSCIFLTPEKSTTSRFTLSSVDAKAMIFSLSYSPDTRMTLSC